MSYGALEEHNVRVLDPLELSIIQDASEQRRGFLIRKIYKNVLILGAIGLIILGTVLNEQKKHKFTIPLLLIGISYILYTLLMGSVRTLVAFDLRTEKDEKLISYKLKRFMFVLRIIIISLISLSCFILNDSINKRFYEGLSILAIQLYVSVSVVKFESDLTKEIRIEQMNLIDEDIYTRNYYERKIVYGTSLTILGVIIILLHVYTTISNETFSVIMLCSGISLSMAGFIYALRHMIKAARGSKIDIADQE